MASSHMMLTSWQICVQKNITSSVLPQMLSIIPFQVSPLYFIKTSLPTFSSFKQMTLLAFKTWIELSLQFTTKNFGFIFYYILFYTKNEGALIHLECSAWQYNSHNILERLHVTIMKWNYLISSCGRWFIYKFYNCNCSKNKNYKIKSPSSLWYTNWSHLNKQSFRSQSFFMASNEDPNMKAKRARTFLYLTFLIFYLRYIYYLQNKLSKAVLFALKIIWNK